MSTPQEIESAKIYMALFGQPIPSIVRAQYLETACLLDAGFSPMVLERYYKAVTACEDLEALEVAARYTRWLGLLPRKFRLMVYLAETRPENQKYFINKYSSLPGGLIASGLAVLHTVWKLIKGIWILRQVQRG